METEMGNDQHNIHALEDIEHNYYLHTSSIHDPHVIQSVVLIIKLIMSLILFAHALDNSIR